MTTDPIAGEDGTGQGNIACKDRRRDNFCEFFRLVFAITTEHLETFALSRQGGAAANMRRVASSFCTDNAAVPEVHKAEHRREADECAQAMQRLLEAETEEQVRSAEMVMNILCQD